MKVNLSESSKMLTQNNKSESMYVISELMYLHQFTYHYLYTDLCNYLFF